MELIGLILLILGLVGIVSGFYKPEASPPADADSEKLDEVRSQRLGENVLSKLFSDKHGGANPIGYGDCDIISPDGQHEIQWVYDGEPPHGDSLNLVWLDGKKMPGRYWGRGHIWSPDSQYITIERLIKVHEKSELIVVRVMDQKYILIKANSTAISFVFPKLTFKEYGDNKPEETHVFTGNECWFSVT